MILKSFIVFEGLDGTGTTTQLEILKNKISTEKAFFTAEPTNHETGLFLRNILKAKINVCPETASFLFAADRYEHIYSQTGIISELKKNKVVFSDRYLFSSLAYQSLDCGYELPKKLNEDFPLPEYLFFFDMNPIDSLNRVIQRAQKKGETTEIFEKQEIQQKTYLAYKKVLQEYQNNNCGMKIIIIKADDSIQDISEKIWSILKTIPILSR